MGLGQGRCRTGPDRAKPVGQPLWTGAAVAGGFPDRADSWPVADIAGPARKGRAEGAAASMSAFRGGRRPWACPARRQGQDNRPAAPWRRPPVSRQFPSPPSQRPSHQTLGRENASRIAGPAIAGTGARWGPGWTDRQEFQKAVIGSPPVLPPWPEPRPGTVRAPDRPDESGTRHTVRAAGLLVLRLPGTWGWLRNWHVLGRELIQVRLRRWRRVRALPGSSG